MLIQIQDNGCGISTETLSKILRGETITNKPEGHGLGLPHAIKAIEKEWKGSIYIKSSINSGTTIDISLPQVRAPNWFLPSLYVVQNETIVILDDDDSIHQVWKKRFEETGADFTFIHYYNPQELLNDYLANNSRENIFLIDFEFIGCDKNGLDIIKELDITNKSYLVTSRHEDLTVREICESIGLKIIPKTFAVYIPINLSKTLSSKLTDLIFIDDDIAITGAWVLHGLTKGKTIAAYNSIHSFKADINKYASNVPIYIDSDLNDVKKGQEFAKELYVNGFKNIYLATGYNASQFEDMPWIKAIVGKEPPF